MLVHTAEQMLYICDQIRKNVHSSHIHFFNFGDSQNFLGMTDICETFRNCRTTISLSSVKVSNLYTIHSGFYGSRNLQNRMCKLCIFSQIQSYILHILYSWLVSMLTNQVASYL